MNVTPTQRLFHYLREFPLIQPRAGVAEPPAASAAPKVQAAAGAQPAASGDIRVAGPATGASRTTAAQAAAQRSTPPAPPPPGLRLPRGSLINIVT